MQLPCERAIWYTLPQIRADLARELVKSGLSQKDVAEKLGVTASAVSQYLHKKRGKSKKMSEDYEELMKDTALKILENPSDDELERIICYCCTKTRA
ncbi:MAG: helix-turn-helix domain-containing protein [Methanobacteriota archaeon]